MANVLQPSFKAALLLGGVDLSAVDVKVALVDTEEYTYDAGDVFLDDIPSEAIVAISGALGDKTTTGGTFDSRNPVFTAATGPESEALWMFVDSGDPETSLLIGWFDTGVTGLPVTPNGGDINLTVNALGWFSL